MESLIIQLISGALGGNLAGKMMKESSLGTLWNSVAGIAGGGLGGKLVGMVMPALASGEMSLEGILGSVAGGGVGGGIVMAVIGMIKKAMAK